MAPRSSSRRSRKSVVLKRHGSDGSLPQVPVKKRRVKTTTVDGIKIHEFHDEIEMEFFSNLQEPIPRKMRSFKGFDDERFQHLDSLKNFFDKNKEKFIAFNSRNSVKRKANVFNASSSRALHDRSKKEKQLRHVNGARIAPVTKGARVPVAVVSPVPPAEVIDINSVNAGHGNDGPGENVSKPAEVITIESDSDDDVVMISDPSVPLPLPRGCRSSTCPNCGKLRTGNPSNRSSSGSLPRQLPNAHEVTVVTDEEVVVEDVPLHQEPQSVHVPPAEQAEDAAQIVDMPAVEEDRTEVPLDPEVKSPEVTEEGKSSLMVGEVFTLLGQQLGPKPPSSQPRQSNKTVPKRLVLRSCKTGKTFQLTINEEKSKILPPAAVAPATGKSPHRLSSGDLKAGSLEVARRSVPANFPSSGLSPKPLQQSSSLPKSSAKDLKPAHIVGTPEDENPSKAKGFQEADSIAVAVSSVPTKFPDSNVSSKPLQQPSPVPNSTGKGPKPVQVIGSPKVENPYKAKPVVAGGLNGPRPKIAEPKEILPDKSETSGAQPHVQILKPSAQKAAPATLNGTTGKLPLPAGILSKTQAVGSSDISVALAPADIENLSPKKTYIMVDKAQLQKCLGQVTAVKNNKNSASVQHSNEMKANVLPQRQVSNVASVQAKMVGLMNTINSEPAAVEDATRSVVNRMIDFVCLQERFPPSVQYQYDEKRPELRCHTVPCGELQCRLGCVCISLSKKSVRRARCNKVECIFGCNCRSHNVAPTAKAKTAPKWKKLEGVSRRKQMHTVLQDYDVGSAEMRSSLSTQAPIKGYMAVQKPVSFPKTGNHETHSPDGAKRGSGTPSKPANGVRLVQKVSSIQRYNVSHPQGPHAAGSMQVFGVLRGPVAKPAVNGSVTPRIVRRKSNQAVRGDGMQGSGVGSTNGFHPSRAVVGTQRSSHPSHSPLDSRVGTAVRSSLSGLHPAQNEPSSQRSSSHSVSSPDPFNDSGIGSPPQSTPNTLKTVRAVHGPEGSSQPSDSSPGVKQYSGPGAAPNGMHRAQTPNIALQGRPNLTMPAAQPRRCYGREKIPIPEHALMCMTPGLGYVPLDETTPKVIIRDPFKDGHRKSFLHIRQATEYLNANLSSFVKTAANLMWVVANKSTLEKKQLHRLSIDSLKDLET